MVEPTLGSLSKNSASYNEDFPHPTNFKTIMRFQQKDKSLMQITKDKPNDYSIKQFNGADKTNSLISRHDHTVISR